MGLESIKYDLEHEVVIKDYEVNQVTWALGLNLKLKEFWLVNRNVEKLETEFYHQFRHSFEAFLD